MRNFQKKFEQRNADFEQGRKTIAFYNKIAGIGLGIFLLSLAVGVMALAISFCIWLLK